VLVYPIVSAAGNSRKCGQWIRARTQISLSEAAQVNLDLRLDLRDIPTVSRDFDWHSRNWDQMTKVALQKFRGELCSSPSHIAHRKIWIQLQYLHAPAAVSALHTCARQILKMKQRHSTPDINLSGWGLKKIRLFDIVWIGRMGGVAVQQAAPGITFVDPILKPGIIVLART